MGLVELPEVLRRHRVTVDGYHRMTEAGVPSEDARVELIEGETLDMAPMPSRHASVVARLVAMWAAQTGGQALVWSQLPLRLRDHSEPEPEPDLMLLAPREDFYAGQQPGPGDVRLPIEASDTTATYDRKVRLPLYARRGVREAWIVDLDNHVLRTVGGPKGDTYAEVVETAHPGTLAPQALPGVSIGASKLLE